MAHGKVPHHDPALLPDDVEALYPFAEQQGPQSLLEFQRLFATEKQCADYLQNLRWPEGFVCPKCGSPTGYTIATRRVTECENTPEGRCGRRQGRNTRCRGYLS